MNLLGSKTFIAITFLGIGITVGVLIMRFHPQSDVQDTSSVRQGGYTFINPLLFCNISESKQFDEYKPIAVKFQAYIKKHISNGDAQNISVYFRGLDSGHWSGVNENDTYAPASLSKVPLMIAYLKEANTNPKVLQQQIVYHATGNENSMETFKPKESIEDGKTYSVADLLKYMIVYSDNNAAALLQDHVDKHSLTDVYSDIGIPASATLIDETMSPKVYSYVFRILYNATYLSKTLSQYALALLTLVDFPGGIKGDIPSSVSSAQKFGERTVSLKDPVTGKISVTYRELHDCGIIYYPKNPYLLCVMTRGSDFSKLSYIISDISALVYQETSSGVLKI